MGCALGLLNSQVGWNNRKSWVDPLCLPAFYTAFAISYLLSGAVDPALVWPPPAPGLVGPRHQGVLLSPSVFP